MLLQTNSYIVPNDKREEHARLMRRFRQVMARLGCDCFEVYEQVGGNFGPLKSGGRFVQLMRFRDRREHQAVQNAEREDPAAQDLIREFCAMIDFQAQQEQGVFAMGHYSSVLAGTELEMHEQPAGPGASAHPQPAPPRTAPGPMVFPLPPRVAPDAAPKSAAAPSPSGNSKGHPAT